MLTRYQITLDVPDGARPRAEWAYHLYAALLERLPKAFGESVHRDDATPVSQFLTPGQDGSVRWTISLLGEESENAVSPPLDAAESFTLSREGLRLTVRERRRTAIPDAETLLDRAAHCRGMHALTIRTAAAFRSQGRYVVLPTERLIMQSLIKKWNASVRECPIEDEDGAGAAALWDGIRFRAFRLRDGAYSLKGNRVPGFTGRVTLENRLDGFHRTLADALLIFSGYAGIGIKTALGMGGVEYAEEERPSGQRQTGQR